MPAGEKSKKEDHKKLVTRSTDIARQVLPFMGKNRIAATPENYMIFYSYFEGDIDLVRQIVDEQLNSGMEWNQQTTDRIFKRIFSSDANVALLKNNQRLTEQILLSARHVRHHTDVTAKLADRTADNLENSIQDVESLDSLDEATEWVESSLGQMRKFNQLSQRLGINLREEGVKLDKIVEAFENMEAMAYTDELTKLNNRRAWERRLKAEFDRFKRSGRQSCVFMMDIDDFKHVNDNFGHDVGDMALKAVAKILQVNLRSYDYPARYGGEEFCCLLPDTELNLARAVAERVRRKLESTRFAVRGQEVILTASFGISFFRPKDQTGNDCVRRSDLAMYLAKSKGKNRVYSDREVKAASSTMLAEKQAKAKAS